MTLRDAIKWWDHWVKPSAPSNELTKLVAAARRVAEAPERDWCEIHFCTGQEDWCWAGVAGASPNEPCRMVHKLLVDPPEENDAAGS